MLDLFIPNKLNVGFVKRDNTFDGKLSYIIYYDEKGTLRKQGSWDNWRDKSLNNLLVDNKPQKGLIINKGVKHNAYHFGTGKSMARIYDPRGFDFEITIDNLVGIINQSNIELSEIVQECVYAWSGKELVLLPTNSEQYKSSLIHTQNKNSKISLKDLKVGQTYSLKNSEKYHVYIGYYEINSAIKHPYGDMMAYISPSRGKKHIFYSVDEQIYKSLSSSNLGRCIDSGEYEDTENLVNNFVGSSMNKPISRIEIFNDYTLEDLINNKFGDSSRLVFARENKSPFHRPIYNLVYRTGEMEKKETPFNEYIDYKVENNNYIMVDNILVNPWSLKNKNNKEKSLLDYLLLSYDGMEYSRNIKFSHRSYRDLVDNLKDYNDFKNFKESFIKKQYKEWKDNLKLGILQVVFEDGTKDFIRLNF